MIPTEQPKNARQYTASEKLFIDSFNFLSEDIFETAVRTGWWKQRDELVELAKAKSEELGDFTERAIAVLGIALTTTELSEAVEGLRNDAMDDKIPEFTMEEAEYADAIIRLMDAGKKRKLRIAEAIIAKTAMNKTRKPMHGGKKF